MQERNFLGLGSVLPSLVIFHPSQRLQSRFAALCGNNVHCLVVSDLLAQESDNVGARCSLISRWRGTG